MVTAAYAGIALAIASVGSASAFGGIESRVGDTAAHGSWHVASPSHHGDSGKKYIRHHKQESYLRDRAKQYTSQARGETGSERRTSRR